MEETMKCIICEFDRNDWEDVTLEYGIKIKLTSTTDKLGFLVVYHKETKEDLGTFELTPWRDGKQFFTLYDAQRKDIKIISRGKCYFNILKKK